MGTVSNLSYIGLSYFFVLFLFMILFGFKGLLRSLGFSIKIIGSIAIPFMAYKKAISLVKTNFDNNEFLSSLILNYPILSEVSVFIIIFILSYLIFSLMEKFLKINITRNLITKIIDFVLGSLYGLFLFSLVFYFLFNLFLKNYFDKNINKVVLYNISLYDNLRSYKEEEIIKNNSLAIEKQDEIY